MDRKLHLLESFDTRGSDGTTYKVYGFEHMVRDPSSNAGDAERWEPTGTSEYRLADGTLVSEGDDGALHVNGKPLTLTRH